MHLGGEIDWYTSTGLREVLAGLIAAGDRHLILDVTDVVFIDSTGLSMLTGLHRSRSPAGARPHWPG